MTATAAGASRTGSRGAALATVLGVLFLTFLDTTIVSVTLGDLVSDIKAGVISLQWVINAYALVFASLMLLGGSLADRFGRKKVMVAGIVVFTAGSLMCALASSILVVIAGRAVMGLGAAASEPGTLSVIRQLFPDRRSRARALGAWSAVSGLALAVGPVVGGVLVGAGGWRWVFWFNLGISVVLLAAVLTFVPESRDPRPGRLDLPGFVLGAAGLGLVIFAAISGEYEGYGTPWIVALFIVGAACVVAFVLVELRSDNPMLNLHYVRRPIVASALYAAFAVYFGVFAIFFFTALYLDLAQDYSGGRLAGMFAPMAAAIVAGGVLTGRWVARVGSRWPTVAGCAVAAAGTLLARYELNKGDEFSFGLLSVALAVAGLGFGVTVVPLTSSVLAHVPSRHSGMAASATNTARQLGAVVAVAALGAVINARLTAAVDDINPFLLKVAGGKEKAISLLQTGGDLDGNDLGSLVRTAPFKPFVVGFLNGLSTALLIAIALVVLAGVIAAFVREPPPEVDEDDPDGSGDSGDLDDLDDGQFEPVRASL